MEKKVLAMPANRMIGRNFVCTFAIIMPRSMASMRSPTRSNLLRRGRMTCSVVSD
jgi:hypothetical protein